MECRASAAHPLNAYYMQHVFLATFVILRSCLVDWKPLVTFLWQVSLGLLPLLVAELVPSMRQTAIVTTLLPECGYYITLSDIFFPDGRRY